MFTIICLCNLTVGKQNIEEKQKNVHQFTNYKNKHISLRHKQT